MIYEFSNQIFMQELTILCEVKYSKTILQLVSLVTWFKQITQAFIKHLKLNK